MTNKIKYGALLIAALLVQMWSYHYKEIIATHPRSIHSWRQTDCLSFTLSFYHERGSFTEPCVNNLGLTGTGKVASDFPIVQYTVAQLWKVFGKSEFIFRLIELGFLFMGLCFTYLLLLFVSKNNYIISILLTCLFFTSPILSYYGPGFLSDIQALGLSIGGLYFFLQWLDARKSKHLYFAVLFYLFAGLLKMSSGFIYAICLGILAIQIIQMVLNKESVKELFNLKNCVLLLLPFVAWFIWYYHVARYNEQYLNRFFLIGILPIWKISAEERRNIARVFFPEMLPQMLNSGMLLLIFSISSAIILSNIKRIFSTQIMIFVITITVFVGYLLLFFQVFNIHDYYLINMMPVLIILLAFIFYTASNNNNLHTLLQKPFIKIFLLLIVIVFTYITAIKTQSRFDFKKDSSCLVINKTDADFYEYNSWFERTRYEVLESKSFDLETLGIHQNDTIICLGDRTINRSLYLLDRVGYTSFNVHVEDIGPFIEKKKKKGLKYLVLIEKEWKEEPHLKPYLLNKLYEEKETSVYRL